MTDAQLNGIQSDQGRFERTQSDDGVGLKDGTLQALQPQILIVDDARDIREPLSRFLQQSGFRTVLAGDSVDARRALANADIDLVVLDVMMPGEDGLSLCRELRAKSKVPVILLTALSEETDRIVGLEVGADDYVTKPFSPRELTARIKAVLRRSQSPAEEESENKYTLLKFEGWVFHKAKRELRDPQGVLISLSTTELQLLGVFLSHPQEVLARGKLLAVAFARQEQMFDRTIDNQVSRLRRKLGDTAKTPRLIKTVRGGGYIFTAEVAGE